MDEVNIPSRDECYRLFRRTGMQPQIIRHSQRVCRVALLLTQGLNCADHIFINQELVQAAALLHDITKTRSLVTGENHPRTAEIFLTMLGYPEVGKIVAQHVQLDCYFESETPGAAEIVNYADKRVLNDTIVSLRHRMRYILKRYAKTANDARRIERLLKLSLQAETRIFEHLAVSPDQLEDWLNTTASEPFC